MPLAVELLLTTGNVSWERMFNDNENAALVPDALVAVRLTVEMPVAMGVPEITPVDVFTVRPAGRPVALNEVGKLLAVIV